jgi:hypothetical protein
VPDGFVDLCGPGSSNKTHDTGGRSQPRAAIAASRKFELATVAHLHVGPQTHRSTRARSSQTVAVKHKDTGPTGLMHATASSMNEYRNRTHMTHAFNER